MGDEIIENYINNKLEEEVKEGLSTNYIKTIIEDNVVEDDSQFIMNFNDGMLLYDDWWVGNNGNNI